MAAVSSNPMDRLASRRCSIYAFDVAKVSFHLPERYVPKNWMSNKFSAELWLQHALRKHPWRTAANASSADLVLLEANYSMMCRAGKIFSGRMAWARMVEALGVPPKPKRQSPGSASPPPARGLHPLLRGSEHVPRAFVLTDNECTPPWIGSRKPSSIQVTDHAARGNNVMAPFVLSRPWWLVGASRTERDPPAPVRMPWSDRQLIFFVGHVPKLYINPTRYLIWRQIRRHPGVTALSATINCTVGSFSVCRGISNMTTARLHTYCTPFCAKHVHDDLLVRINDEPGHYRARGGPNVTIRPPPVAKVKHGRCASGVMALRRSCKAYRKVDFASELADMARSARNLAPHEYFANAMGHRFCIAAPGDFVSTPKITEFVAMAAAGGCLPVLVISGAPEHTLQHTRWIDWCEFAYLVSDRTARYDMASVVRRLEAVDAKEASRKAAAALLVRDAFVWRPPAAQPIAHPSAADYLLGELCVSARRAAEQQRLWRQRQQNQTSGGGAPRTGGEAPLPPAQLAGGAYAGRCMM